MHRLAIPLLFICVLSCVAADTPAPTSPAARKAAADHDAALKLARTDYVKSMEAADTKYIADLTDALHIAMKNEDATETERVQKALQGAAEEAKNRSDEMGDTPSNSPEPSALRKALSGATLWYVCLDTHMNPRPMEFQEGGKIGNGSGRYEKAWSINRQGKLLISGDAGTILQLTFQSDSIWTGIWTKDPHVLVMLVPLH